jgi:hypothetical protein
MNCDCGDLIGTGLDCWKDVNYTSKIGIMRLVADDNTINKIVVSSTMSISVSALVNHADPSKRLYILPDFKESKVTQRELDFTTTPSGVKIRNHNFSNLIFEGKLFMTPLAFASKLNDLLSCGEYGTVYIDEAEGVIAGKIVGGDALNIYPRAINKDSWQVRKGDESTGGDAKNNIVMFDEANSSTIKDWAVWSLDEATLSAMRPVKEVEIASGTGATTTKVNITAKLLFGTENSPIKYTNTTATNWFLDGSSVSAFSSVVVLGNGSLDLTFTTPKTTGTSLSIQLIGGGFVSNKISVTIP